MKGYLTWLLLGLVAMGSTAWVGCHGPREEWRFVRVISKQEFIKPDPTADLYVCFCQALISEEVACSAESDFHYGGGAGINVVGVDMEVSAELGGVNVRGHSIDLAPPTDKGFIYRYQIAREFITTSGEGMFRSGRTDEERQMRFSRIRDCHVSYRLVETLRCQDAPATLQCAQGSTLSAEAPSASPVVLPTAIEIASPPSTDPVGSTETAATVEAPSPIPSTLISPTASPAIGTLKLLNRHPGGATTLTVSPDFRRLATGGVDGTVHLWNAGAGEALGALTGNGSAEIQQLAWSPDNRWIAAGDAGGYIYIWSAETRRLFASWAAHANAILALAWSPDSHWLASGSPDQQIHIWDSLRNFTAHSRLQPGSKISALAWSPDGQLLAAGDFDNEVSVWDWQLAFEVQALVGHRNNITALAWSPDGYWLASSDASGYLGLWAWLAAEQSFQLEGGLQPILDNRILTLAWSRDSTHLAASGYEQALAIYDTVRRAPEYQAPPSRIRGLAFERDAQHLWLASEDGAIYLGATGR